MEPLIEQPDDLVSQSGVDVEIKQFLEGNNPLKYAVAIETYYNKSYADVVIHNKETNEKTIRAISYKPFLFMKDLRANGIKLYETDAQKRAAMNRHGIVVEPLRITDDNGAVVDRLNNGYKYRVSTKSPMGYQALQTFFKDGGIDLWKKERKSVTFRLNKPVEEDLGLYTLVERSMDGVEFLYNNIEKRYEIHIKSNLISKFVDRSDTDDDNISYIKLKAGTVNLQYKKDFDVYHFEEFNKHVVILRHQNTEASQLPEYNEKISALIESFLDDKTNTCFEEIFSTDADGQPITDKEQLQAREKWCLSNAKELDKYEKSLIKMLKDSGDWTDEDAKQQRAINKKRKEDLANAGVEILPYNYKKINVQYSEAHSDLFFTMKNEEQFMIATGIRLFKGFEQYNEVHKFIFDIETTGLSALKGNRVFMIGMRDNRGFEKVSKVAELDNDEEERKILADLFFSIKYINPAIIYGYNSENFDWDFVLKRMEILGLPIEDLPTSLRDGIKMRRRDGASIKFGGETERYTQTIMWGRNILDIYHSVRRTQAINSDLQEGSLKYVCKFEKLAKPDRVYVDGGDIYRMWKEDKFFATDKPTNKYLQIPEELQEELLKLAEEVELTDFEHGGLMELPVSDELRKWFEHFGENTILKRGGWLVDRYLLDDLWETEQVDERYNVDRFMVGQYLPTSFSRTCTMGGASQWNLIMTAWSYEKNLAIPAKVSKVDFVGGLSRTFMLGKFKNVWKFDFSGLYPSEQLEHDIFPKVDITGVLKRLLKYFKETRDVFKTMANDESLDKVLRQQAKTKQLPLKILNNSNFGANGSEYFNWADFFCAERITSTGRLYLRNMIQFFMKYGCIPTVCDTDGINMVVPEIVTVDLDGNQLDEPMPIDNYVYTDKRGKVTTGANALVAKYNQEVLGAKYVTITDQDGYMKLDNDGQWPSAINVSRKNYANMEAPDKDGKSKIKIVGNTLKGKTMSTYIKEFIDNGIKLLLEDKPKEFIEYYYDYVTQIYSNKVPIRKIANKARVKMTKDEYMNRGTDKNGRQKGKQAHMELAIQENLNIQLGDTIYYINDGEKKSHGFTTMNNSTGKLKAYALTKDEMDRNPDRIGSYNVAKYMDAFNKRVSTILTPFKPEVRDTLIVTDPTQRNYYTEEESKLRYYQNPEPKDDITKFFIMEDSEVRFWNRTGLDPYKFLEEFTTGIEYYGYTYQKKLNLVKEKLGAKGIVVKSIHDKYENGDIVVSFNDDWIATNPETKEEETIPKVYHQYITSEKGLGYPLDELQFSIYNDYLHAFGPDTKVILKRKYYINKVESGHLSILKEI